MICVYVIFNIQCDQENEDIEDSEDPEDPYLFDHDGLFRRYWDLTIAL